MHNRTGILLAIPKLPLPPWASSFSCSASLPEGVCHAFSTQNQLTTSSFLTFISRLKKLKLSRIDIFQFFEWLLLRTNGETVPLVVSHYLSSPAQLFILPKAGVGGWCLS